MAASCVADHSVPSTELKTVACGGQEVFLTQRCTQHKRRRRPALRRFSHIDCPRKGARAVQEAEQQPWQASSSLLGQGMGSGAQCRPG